MVFSWILIMVLNFVFCLFSGVPKLVRCQAILQDLRVIRLSDIGFIVVLVVCVDFSYGCMPNKLLGTFSTVLIIDHAAAVG